MPDLYHSDEKKTTGSAGKGCLGSIILVPFSLFPLAALCSYDWRAVSRLCIPSEVSSNLIGPLGDAFAYWGYLIFGFAIWLFPMLCMIVGLRYAQGRSLMRGRRSFFLIVFLVCVSCLLQVAQHHAPWVVDLLEKVNTANAGGLAGFFIMENLLSRLLSDFGASVIVIAVAVISLGLVFGLGNIKTFLLNVFKWGFGERTEKADVPKNASVEEDAVDVPQKEAEDDLFTSDALKAVAAVRKAARRQNKIEKEQMARHFNDEPSEATEGDFVPQEVFSPPPPPPVRRSPPPPRVKPQPAAPVPVAPTRDKTVTESDDSAALPHSYELPPVSLLDPLKKTVVNNDEEIAKTGENLINTLKLFKIDARILYTIQGPVVTKYAIEMPPGMNYSVIGSLSKNIMGALRARSLRIESPIPGENAIGIEVPNSKPVGVKFREVIESPAWTDSKSEIPLLFGKDSEGNDLVADLATMPHLLVAGATGMGKSVCLNSLICGMLMSRTPEQLKLILVDPKMVEFTPYESIPHLLVPIITDNKKVEQFLKWAVYEMEKRLKMFAKVKVKNIYEFIHRKKITQTDMFGNDTADNSDIPATIPYIVMIIDELADLMATSAKEVAPYIQRLAQKARAAGIHLILATQRPDTKVITGTIKANIPGRVAFKTATSVDSRTILDATGAENLIGKGDMFFRRSNNELIRGQGSWISNDEIFRVTEYLSTKYKTQFDSTLTNNLARIKESSVEDPFAEPSEEDDSSSKLSAQERREEQRSAEETEDFKKALEAIVSSNIKRVSTSSLQRTFRWGYNHSSRIVTLLENRGVISELRGMGARTVLMEPEEIKTLLEELSSGEGESATEEEAYGQEEFDMGETSSEENTMSEREEQI
jgi:S-DNA-T family DNA segregation ATPase FtsK/SpoIIIE